MRSLADILEEYEFLDADERYRLLIELGRELDEMPQALKTDATLVRGCSASVWVYPTESGDCEDFVLLKRRMLIDAGWPVGALLITVVRQKNGDGHAVLTVTTSRGDLVLDNLDPHISLWSGTGYRYLKRQSEYDSGEWVEIEDGRANEVGSLTN